MKVNEEHKLNKNSKHMLIMNLRSHTHTHKVCDQTPAHVKAYEKSVQFIGLAILFAVRI